MNRIRITNLPEKFTNFFFIGLRDEKNNKKNFCYLKEILSLKFQAIRQEHQCQITFYLLISDFLLNVLYYKSNQPDDKEKCHANAKIMYPCFTSCPSCLFFAFDHKSANNIALPILLLYVKN